MKRVIICILIFVAGCKAELPKVPADVIAMDKMKVILEDMHVTDAVAETKGQMGMDEKLLSEEYLQQIYKNHSVTREEFLKSYKFYEDNPVLLNKMYDEILSDLSKREAAASKGK